MSCRCDTVTELYGSEAEEYVADHLVADSRGALSCPDTGARWQLDDGEQTVLRQVDPPGVMKD
jgi:hypothetical protein